MTGPFASTGRQIDAAVKLFLAQNGAVHGNRRIEIVVVPDLSTLPGFEELKKLGGTPTN